MKFDLNDVHSFLFISDSKLLLIKNEESTEVELHNMEQNSLLELESILENYGLTRIQQTT